MLLLLTSSGDVTADLLITKFKSSVFRFNLDLFNDYEFELNPTRWEIRSPTGHCINSEIASRCVWWKVFLSLRDEDMYVRSEVKYITNEIYSWFRIRQLVIGNAPTTEDVLGKIRQASIAIGHFLVPEQFVVWGSGFKHKIPSDRSWVVKSLSSQLTSERRALFTTEVDIQDLDPDYPWFIQEKIVSEKDVTVLVVGTQYFAYSRDRSNLSSLDWRAEIFSSETPWLKYDLTDDDIGNLNKMLVEMNISWGRIDFLHTPRGLIFLEVNPNGQWGFLDIKNEFGVIDAVASFFEKGITH